MNRGNTRITVSLLKLVKRLEIEMERLKRCGVTVLPLENAQIDAINVILQVNGIHKYDDAVSWLCEPIFKFLWNDITRAECVRQFHVRLRELKKTELTGVMEK